MDFFENGVLTTFTDTLFHASTFAMNNVVRFMLVAVVALEISRRMAQNGAMLAAMVIIGTALYAIGSTTHFAG